MGVAGMNKMKDLIYSKLDVVILRHMKPGQFATSEGLTHEGKGLKNKKQLRLLSLVHK